MSLKLSPTGCWVKLDGNDPHSRLRVTRATAIAAEEIFTNCARHNPTRPENYLSCVYQVLFAIVRKGAPRDVPIPAELNHSSINRSQQRFFTLADQKLRSLERQAIAGRRPTQSKLVSEAMGMLPSARGGRGSLKFLRFLKSTPTSLQPILSLMSEGIQLLIFRDCFRRRHK